MRNKTRNLFCFLASKYDTFDTSKYDLFDTLQRKRKAALEQTNMLKKIKQKV